MSDTKLSPAINNLIKADEEIQKALSWNKFDLCQWKDFWFIPSVIKAAMVFKEIFKSDPNDVLLASSIKTGSTWLKAICVCIMQGNKEEEEDLLVKDNPHFNVPIIEFMKYYTKALVHDIYTMPSPRLFHTHLSYRILPDSIKNSDNYKIIYIARNPKDTLISIWHFFNYNHNRLENHYPLEEAWSPFAMGSIFMDHSLNMFLNTGKKVKKRPQKILFLKYENLKMDPKKELKKIALFLGKPFRNEEDLEIVLKKCSLERLKSLEVNKSGSIFTSVSNSSFFRKGIIGDWKNHMRPEMKEKIDKITSSKLQGSSLEL